MSAKKTKSRAPEFLADLMDHTKSVLIQNGIKIDKATIISREVSKKMCEAWGGQLIYFPYWLREELDERDLKIYDEFNGDNHEELSKKYTLSVQAIYRIIKVVRQSEIDRRQIALDI